MEIESDDFNRALGNVKWQGQEPAWKRIDFIKRDENIDYNDLK
jgi:hypothetical protein